MKTLIIIATLVLAPAYAQEPDDFVGPPAPYPEHVPVEHFPFIAHWQLTMVRQHEMIDIQREYISRATCMADGIQRIFDEDDKLKNSDWPSNVRYLGFVCEYVEQ